MKEIKSIDEWQTLSGTLSEEGYRVWQMQYGIDHKDGFLSCFIAPGKPDKNFMTRDHKVADAIVSYNGIQRRKTKNTTNNVITS